MGKYPEKMRTDPEQIRAELLKMKKDRDRPLRQTPPVGEEMKEIPVQAEHKMDRIRKEMFPHLHRQLRRQSSPPHWKITAIPGSSRYMRHML